MQQRVEIRISSSEKMQRVRREENSGRHAHQSDQVNQEEQQQGSEDYRQTDSRYAPSHPRGVARNHDRGSRDEDEKRGDKRDDAEQDGRRNGKHQLEQQVNGVSSLLGPDHRQ